MSATLSTDEQPVLAHEYVRSNSTTLNVHLGNEDKTSITVKRSSVLRDDPTWVVTVQAEAKPNGGWNEVHFFCRSLEQVRGFVPTYGAEVEQ